MALIFAISGAHGTGKTTLVHSVVAKLKRRGIHAGAVHEVARGSHYLLAGKRSIEMHLEVMGLHLAEEMRASREYDVVIADRSMLDFLAFARARFGNRHCEKYTGALSSFVHAYAHTYQCVFVTSSSYPDEPKDSIRSQENVVGSDFFHHLMGVISETNVCSRVLPGDECGEGIADYIVGQFSLLD